MMWFVILTIKIMCFRSLTEQDKLIGIEQGLVNREGGATCISLPFMPSAGNNIVPERRSESNVHINEYQKLTKSKADDKSLVSPATDVFVTGPAESPAATPANVKEEMCVICMDTVTNPKELLCKHRFCTECIDNCFAQCQPKCPSCGQMFGAMKGNQPNGTMTHRALPYSLAGHPVCGHIEISYTFPSGIQEVNNVHKRSYKIILVLQHGGLHYIIIKLFLVFVSVFLSDLKNGNN